MNPADNPGGPSVPWHRDRMLWVIVGIAAIVRLVALFEGDAP